MLNLHARTPLLLCGLFLLLLPAADAQQPAPAEADGIEFFEARIRPVLVERCYECHNSVDNAEAGLALDWREPIRRGSDSGAVIDPGAPSRSLLVRVMRHELDGLEMPQGGPKLDDATIADFERWIAIGAPDPRDRPPRPEELAENLAWEQVRERRKQWWSFQPIRRPAVPQSNSGWSDHPIDRFIERRLGEAGLQPQSEAPAEVVVRRAYLALTGLPPDGQAVQAFLQDSAPDAFERLVEQLLASERFGERWARHWMDWVRYAESHGSEGDPPIDGAYQYRDYLIRSLNADVPFDQLLREHIAGDLIASPRMNHELGINESAIGTAHWRMVFHGFAPTDALDEKVRFTDDAIATFSKAFLGLTVHCARCHDHKFDPISQQDYYALFGIIGSTRPGRLCIDAPQRLEMHREELSALKQEIRQRLAQCWSHRLQTADIDVGKILKELECDERVLELLGNDGAAAKRQLVKSLQNVANQVEAFGAASRALNAEFEGPDMPDGWFSYGTGLLEQPGSPGQFTLQLDGDSIVEDIYPAAVVSHSLSSKHAARLTSSDVQLDGKIDLWLLVRGGGRAMSRYVVQNYPRNGTVYPVTEFRNPAKDDRWHWVRYPLDYWEGDAIHVELTTARDAPLLVKPSDRSWFALRRAVIVPQGTPQPPSLHYLAWNQLVQQQADDLSQAVADALQAAVEAWEQGRGNDGQAMLLSAALRAGQLPNSLGECSTVAELVAEYRRLEAEIPVPTRVPGLAEWKGHDQPLFLRGDHRRPADPVPRRFLEAIDPTPYDTPLSGRLELASDMLRPDNPLTARVIVNRVWHHLFGQGLVATVDNFGRLGEQPSHPELLDYLAWEFRTRHKWSLKSLIREIVTSRTWRQDSRPSPLALQRDPNNRLLSHFTLQRMDAEPLRDAILAASGQLDLTMFGPSVPGNVPRRSVYVQVIRNRLDPFLKTFDAPVPFSTTGRRDNTNVPAQSLMMMNNAMVRGAAEKMARAIDSGTDVADGVTLLWQRVLSRRPTDSELQSALRFLADVRRNYDQQEQLRKQLRATLAETRQELDAVLNAARGKVAAQRPQSPIPLPGDQPVWQWDAAKDQESKLTLHGTARVDANGLVLDGKGWAVASLPPGQLVAKTLEAVVQLDSLDQRGGGVLSLQTKDGSVFDAIVFGEQRPGHWMAGSDFFRRTQDAGGPPETQADKRPVHVTITYSADGKVTLYRNGEPYGSGYQVQPAAFSGQASELLLGMRHGTQLSPGRMLRGRVLSARLWGRALTAAEVRAAADSRGSVVTEQQLLAALSEQELLRADRLKAEVATLSQQLAELPERGDVMLQAWTDLAHSLLNTKEFLYVR